MRVFTASEFESRRHDFLRVAIFGVALLAYQVDRDDIVWRFIHWHSPAERALAQAIFALSALLGAFAITLQTWARAYMVPVGRESQGVSAGPYRILRHPFLLGEFLFAVAMGFYLSLLGAILALAGTALLEVRLLGRGRFWVGPPSSDAGYAGSPGPQWSSAFRADAAHWGYLLMMIVFTITLRDALAWGLAATAFFAGLALNFRKSPIRKEVLICLALLRIF